MGKEKKKPKITKQTSTLSEITYQDSADESVSSQEDKVEKASLTRKEQKLNALKAKIKYDSAKERLEEIKKTREEGDSDDEDSDDYIRSKQGQRKQGSAHQKSKHLESRHHTNQKSKQPSIEPAPRQSMLSPRESESFYHS